MLIDLVQLRPQRHGQWLHISLMWADMGSGFERSPRIGRCHWRSLSVTLVSMAAALELA